MSGYLRGDTLLTAEHCAKVDRVIEAARALRTKLGKRNTCILTGEALMGAGDELSRLAFAIDALDAPVERYCVHDCGGQVVRCGERIDRFAVLDRTNAGLALVYADSARIAEKIAAALNAAERNP